MNYKRFIVGLLMLQLSYLASGVMAWVWAVVGICWLVAANLGESDS